MYKLICFALLFISAQLNAQYKNDNVLYKTVYAEDLPEQLKANPGYLLLDVRSKGENEDTSSMLSMNIGHLKDAKNINVRELGSKINELQAYKNTPVFVYCSHSQRSRRASKMLADSGFTKVFNINGGMTTMIQTNTNNDFKKIYTTNVSYERLSPAQFCKAVNENNSYLLDVRPDSSYNAATTSEVINAMGKLKNAAHIPLASLENSLSELPKDKKIILADDYSDESIKAANLLTSKGFTNVAILFNGIYNLMGANNQDVNCKSEVWQQNKKYTVLSPDEFNLLAKKNKDIAIVDVRSAEEFNNQSKDYWRNGGHIKNAINISYADMHDKFSTLKSFIDKPVILYSFGSSDEVYKAAAILTANNFNKVYILYGGLFSLRWRSANIKGEQSLKDWVTDIPADNL